MWFYKKYPTILALCLFFFLCWHARPIGALSNNRVWRISTGIIYAYHQLYDVPAWNCNGSRLMFRGRKNTVYLTTATANAVPDRLWLPGKPVGFLQWDRLKADLLYYASTDKTGQTAIFSFNVNTREAKLLFKAPAGLQLAPCHPDGEYLLLYPQAGGAGIAEIYSLQTKKVFIVPLPRLARRVRFTKHPDLSVFCNLETENSLEQASWILDAHTGAAKPLTPGMVGTDWQPGGNSCSFFGEDGLHIASRKGDTVRVIPGISGHQSWSEDGKYIVADITNPKSKYYGEIITTNVENGETKIVTEYHSKIVPKQTGYPEPVFSPDRTKVVYNSNDDGKTNLQVYVAQVKLPDPVKNLRLIKVKGSTELTWASSGAKETKCYQVYKVYSDKRRARLGEVEARQAKYPVKWEEGLRGFEVTVKEYSGLEGEAAKVEIGAKSGSWLNSLF